MSELMEVVRPWVIVLIFVVIIVLCVMGNSLVLFVILTRKHMQTVTNCFIASLSVSDLLVGLVVVSLATVQTLSTGTIQGAACQIPIYFESVCSTASIYSLLSISFDRYKAVVQSSVRTFTIQKSMVIIIGVWLWSFLYACKIFVLFAVNFDKSVNVSDEAADGQNICNLLVEEEGDDFWFRVADAFVLFALPFTAMTFMYIGISRRLWFSKLAVNTAVRRKRNVVKFLIYNIILFFCTWAPFYISELTLDGLRLMSVLSGEEEEALESAKWYIIFRFVVILLALSNSFLNPVLYAFFNLNFQAEIKSMVNRSRGRVAPRHLTQAGSRQGIAPLPTVSSNAGLLMMEQEQPGKVNSYRDGSRDMRILSKTTSSVDLEARVAEDGSQDWNF